MTVAGAAAAAAAAEAAIVLRPCNGGKKQAAGVRVGFRVRSVDGTAIKATVGACVLVGASGVHACTCAHACAWVSLLDSTAFKASSGLCMSMHMPVHMPAHMSAQVSAHMYAHASVHGGCTIAVTHSIIPYI